MRFLIFTEKLKLLRNVCIVVSTITVLFLYWRTIDVNSWEYSLCSVASGSVACAFYSKGTQLPNNILFTLLPGLPIPAIKINEEIAAILKNLPEIEAQSLVKSEIPLFYSALLIPFGGLVLYQMLK